MAHAFPAGLIAPTRHSIGVITPSGNTVVERVTIGILRSFPDVACHFSRTAVFGSSDPYPDDYDWASMMDAARLLSHARPDIICWNGSKGGSIDFDLDRKLCERIVAETGCAATTSTLALQDLLGRTGGQTFGLISPYQDAYQKKVIKTFERAGYRCLAESHAAMLDNLSYASFPDDEIRTMTVKVAAKKPDFIVAWCTNFPSAPLAGELEQLTGIPFYDSAALAVWHCLDRLAVNTTAGAAWGSLFSSDGVVAAREPARR